MAYQGQSHSVTDSKTKAQQKSIVSESILNYETVGSMANEDVLIERYFTNDGQNEKTNDIKLSMRLSIAYGIASSALFFFNYPIFVVLTNKIDNGANYKNVYIAVSVAVWGTCVLIATILDAPEFKRGKEAATVVLNLESQDD